MSRVEVRSEISGVIWKIETAVGARVGEGDAILTVEAMKMEIPVAAPRAGHLAEVLVAEGDLVAEGQVVAVLTSP